MGRDKASLPFGPETLLQRVVRIVASATGDVVVAARPGQDLPPLPKDVRVVRDDVPDSGPLAGLVPGLRASRADIVFATGCDAPLLVPAVIGVLFDRLGTHEAAAAFVDGHAHPLCAVYRRRAADEAERLLAARRLRATDLLDALGAVRVTEAELRAADPDLASFAPCNTPEAYAAALARAGL
jgi:molybdopterin-guanine dinucleotide biosynthesis protein A